MSKIWIEFDDSASPMIRGHNDSSSCGCYYWLGDYQCVGGFGKEEVGVRSILRQWCFQVSRFWRVYQEISTGHTKILPCEFAHHSRPGCTLQISGDYVLRLLMTIGCPDVSL